MTDADAEVLAAVLADRDGLHRELVSVHEALGAATNEHPIDAARRVAAERDTYRKLAEGWEARASATPEKP